MRRNSFQCLVLFASVALVGGAGCLTSSVNGPQDKDGGMGSGDGAVSDGSQGNGGGGGADYLAAFDAKVAPAIMSTGCTVCHGMESGGIGPGFFFPKPDLFTSVVAFPGMVSGTPETSRLYTKGAHEGGTWFAATQAQDVYDWIVLYNANKPATGSNDGGVPPPAIAPFEPIMGPNAIDLSILDPALAGMKLTFTAKMVGLNLELSALSLVAAPGMGMRVKHPLFTVWSNDLQTATPGADDFAGLDQTVYAGETQPLGPGLFFLTNFTAGMKMNVSFESIGTQAGGGDGGAALGCKSVAMWTSMVKPKFSPGIQINCANCHGNANNNASIALSMVGIGNAANDGTICLNTRGVVDTANPANSRIFVIMDPNSGVNHTGGKFTAANLTTFQTDVTVWINAEK